MNAATAQYMLMFTNHEQNDCVDLGLALLLLR